MPGLLQPHGEADHLGHVLGGPGEHVGRQDVDQRLVRVEARLVGVGDLARRLGLQAGRDQHPVLAAVEPLVAEMAHVGDVLDVPHPEAVVQQHAADEVGEQVRPQVADVGPAVHGRSAGVHPDDAVVGDGHGFDAAAQRVAEVEGHGVARGPGGMSIVPPVATGARQEIIEIA